MTFCFSYLSLSTTSVLYQSLVTAIQLDYRTPEISIYDEVTSNFGTIYHSIHTYKSIKHIIQQMQCNNAKIRREKTLMNDLIWLNRLATNHALIAVIFQLLLQTI